MPSSAELSLQAFEVVSIKERFLVDVGAAGGGWVEAGDTGGTRRLEHRRDREGSRPAFAATPRSQKFISRARSHSVAWSFVGSQSKGLGFFGFLPVGSEWKGLGLDLGGLISPMTIPKCFQSSVRVPGPFVSRPARCPRAASAHARAAAVERSWRPKERGDVRAFIEQIGY